MRLAYALRDIILEQSRFDVLLDKYASKKKDKKSGKEIKPLMDLSILGQIIFADPTTKKPEGTDETDSSVENLSRVQPGAYTNWLLKNYVTPEMEMDSEVDYKSPAYQKAVIEGRRLFMEDLFKVNGDLKKFSKYKQYFPQDKRDINRFANPTDLFNFLSTFQLPEKKQKEIDKKELKKEIRKEREGFSHPGATIEFTGDKWSVIKIEGTGEKQQEAATWFGGFYDYDNGESRWCTSPPNSSYFKTYAKDGPLYVILSNDESGPVGKRTGLPQLRYQFHFPSNQFMDRADHRVDLINMLNNDMSELKEYFKPEFAKGMTTSGGKKVEIEYPNSSAAKFIALYGFDEFFASLPDDITNLLFNNKSNETIALDVPSTLGRFKNLEALLLMNCVKTIPNEIGQLSNLSFLALPDNSALKSLPDSLLQLPNLMFVNLKGSKPNLSEAFNAKFGEEGVAGSGFFTKKM
jgi:Leucine-rich repeat (LRR) protein